MTLTPNEKTVAKQATLRAELAEVRKQMTALKEEEDRILALLKRQGWEDVGLEAAGVLGGAVIAGELGGVL